MRRLIGSVAAVAMLAIAFGAVSASAHDGTHVGRVSTSKLVTAAASQLNVSRASLVAAIQSSANTTIAGAVDDENITADQASDLKDEVADNLNEAYALSRASTVASKLGITSAALNTGFRSARKALLDAQIDAAATAGTLTADQATTLKAQVDASTAGYKSVGRGGLDRSGGGPGGGSFGDHGHGGH
jgi:predicted DNA-binding protein (UPF0251 family)